MPYKIKDPDRLTDTDREYLRYKMTPPKALGKEPRGSLLTESQSKIVEKSNDNVQEMFNTLSEATDPYLLRNEFKPRFYNQKDKPPTTAETMYGKGTKKQLEYPTVDPDTKMMEDARGMAEGGSVRGQKNVQVKKKPFRGVF